MEKKCLVITGPSTVGKSTVIKSVVSHLPEIHVIPLSTSRVKRKDDDPIYIRHFSNMDFLQQDFFVSNGQYGLIRKDIHAFEQSPSSLGICTLGAVEIQRMRREARFKIYVVLLRFQNSPAEEKEYIRERIPKFFPENEAKKRIQANEALLKRYFYNPEFLRDSVQEVRLFREGVDAITRSILALPAKYIL